MTQKSGATDGVRDLIILGGGVGGLVTASVVAQLGLKVTLIEKSDRLGGDCLNYGCVPSKTLIHSARIASDIRRASEFGLPEMAFKVDLKAVMDRVRAVIAKIAVHDDPERFRGYGCEVLFGEAAFVDASTVLLDDQKLTAKKFLIATGSRPLVPPIDGLKEAGYQTNETIFSLERLPENLVVIGGGPIGLELAQAFQRLGSQVTVLELSEQLLGREDVAIADRLFTALKGDGIKLHLGTGVERVTLENGRKQVIAGDQVFTCDEILVAVGRQPNIENLGLDVAGVKTGRQGIEVDTRLRTNQKHIFACGDVVGPYPFTHMAEYQAGIVIANVAFKLPKKVNYRVVPWVTYTHPELARVGLTEAETMAQGMRVKVLQFDFKDIDRAIAAGETEGMIKLVVKGRQIVGASILGPGAGELIHEIVLAMQAKVPIGKLSAAIHAYPTLAQINRRAVNTAYADSLFSERTRKIVRWLHSLLP